jgi:hypothetical protein
MRTLQTSLHRGGLVSELRSSDLQTLITFLRAQDVDRLSSRVTGRRLQSIEWHDPGKDRPGRPREQSTVHLTSRSSLDPGSTNTPVLVDSAGIAHGPPAHKGIEQKRSHSDFRLCISCGRSVIRGKQIDNLLNSGATARIEVPTPCQEVPQSIIESAAHYLGIGRSLRDCASGALK